VSRTKGDWWQAIRPHEGASECGAIAEAASGRDSEDRKRGVTGVGQQAMRGTQSLCADILAGPDRRFTPINAPDYSAWGRSNEAASEVSAAPSDPGASAQYHGKFASAQPSKAAEIIALLRVGCAATTASAAKTDGIWTVRIGDRTVVIDAKGTVSVAP